MLHSYYTIILGAVASAKQPVFLKQSDIDIWAFRYNTNRLYKYKPAYNQLLF